MENVSTIDLYQFTSLFPFKEYNCKNTQEPCIICQKPVNVSEKTKYVHYLTNGHVTNVLDHVDSQGMFPIGNDCCKRLPLNFVFTY